MKLGNLSKGFIISMLLLSFLVLAMVFYWVQHNNLKYIENGSIKKVTMIRDGKKLGLESYFKGILNDNIIESNSSILLNKLKEYQNDSNVFRDVKLYRYWGLKKELNNINQVIVTNRDKRALFAPNIDKSKANNHSLLSSLNQDDVDRFISNKDFTPGISDYYLSEKDSSIFFTIITPIKDIDHNEIGFLIYVIVMDDFLDKLMQLDKTIAKNEEIIIVNDKFLMRNNSITDTNYTIKKSILGVRYKSKVAELALSGKTGYLKKKNTNNVEEVFAYAPLNVGYMKWAIIAKSKILVPPLYYTLLSREVIAAAFLLIIISMLAFYLWLTKITKPLELAVHRAKKISGSELKKNNSSIQAKHENEFSQLNDVLNDIDLDIKNQISVIEQKQSKFRLLFENNTMAMILIDSKSYRIIDANQAASNFYGYTIAELKELSLSNFCANCSFEACQQCINSKLSISKSLTRAHKLKNGEIKKIELNFSEIKSKGGSAIFIIINDITEREKNKSRLLLLDAAVSSTKVSIIISDNHGNIEFVNPNILRLTGYGEKFFKTHNLKDIRNMYSHDEKFSYIYYQIKNGNSYSGDVQIKIRNSKQIWVHLVITPIFEKGKLKNYVLVMTDISNLKQMEHNLQVQNKNLADAKSRIEQTDHLKTEFIHNMSHEVRTPLNGIMGFSDLLRTPNISSEKIKQYTEIINKSSKQLMNIIDDILEISLLGSKQLKLQEDLVNVDQLLYSFKEVFESQSKNNSNKLIMDIPKNELELNIIADETKLTKIISNFIDNALKFTIKGTVVYGYHFVDAGESIEFFVKDDGVGINPESLDNIFERFNQEGSALAKESGGLGLGLAIAKENADILDGKIKVDSEVNKGSTFYLKIPRKDLKKS